jgi:ABC-type iron transport system FetAB ATPase subunit
VVYQAAEPAWWAPTVAAHFPDDAHARLGAWMQEIGLSPGLLDTEIPRLSTGERQRLALLRSLARAPAVLLLDEPTASLDTESTLVVEALLARRLAQGLTILMVTHSREQAARIGQRRFEMADGQLRRMP